MTIKESINKYFEENVEFDEDSQIFIEQTFWDAWDKLESDIEHGIQWRFDWYYDQPSLTPEREQFIKKAINKYITEKIMPMYKTSL